MVAALVWLLAASATAAAAPSPAPIHWNDCLAQPPSWYGTDEAVRIADNVLLYQRDTGGWPKNIDMAAVLSEGQAAGLEAHKRDTDSTIDNGATHTQLTLLARVHRARTLPRHRHAFLEGADYLLRAQYDNGGWPQYFPLRPGYYTHITYNDDAMAGVLTLLREVARGAPPYDFVDAARRARAEAAVRKGIECILRTQVVVDGKRTVWCAQHDEVTLAPAPARTYELISLSGYESVGVVRFLMGIEGPDDRVRQAIESAVEWFARSKITGIRWVEQPSALTASGRDRVVVADPAAGPLWARFYEIGTNRPIFSGRDGVKKYSVAEIEEERRNGYRWYVNTPATLLDTGYPAWRKRVGRANTPPNAASASSGGARAAAGPR